MDYTTILNSIDSKLSSIITLLQDILSASGTDLIVLLFTIFLVLWVMRGE